MAYTPEQNRKYRMKPIIVGNNSILERGNADFGKNINNLPDPAAAIQIDDVNAGFLLPRVTTAERDAIAVTAPTTGTNGNVGSTGLMVYNTTTSQIEMYTGSTTTPWSAIGAGGGGATTLAGLSDTAIGVAPAAALAIGDGVIWDGTNWVNQPVQATLAAGAAATQTAVTLNNAVGSTTTAVGATTDAINFRIGGSLVGNVTILPGNITKWTMNGIMDPAIYAGTPQTIAQRDVYASAPDAAKAGYMAYVKDASGVNEYQYFDGTTWQSMGSNSQPHQYVVVDIAARNALTGMVTGDMAYVIDASTGVAPNVDTTVTSGAALYVWDGVIVAPATTGTWHKIAEFESLDITTFTGAAWAATTAYATGEVVTTPAGALVSRGAAGTSTAAFDLTEAGAWTLVQNGPTLNAYPANLYVYAGQMYVDQTTGVAYQFKTSSVANATFLASEWLAIAGNKYSAAIAATTGWTQVAGTDYWQAKVLGTTHGIATPSNVTVAKTGIAVIGAATTGDEPFTPDQVHIAANGDVTITVTSLGAAPAYASKVTIS